MRKRNLLLLSNSTQHGAGYLEWAAQHIKEFLSKRGVSNLLFIPYALSDHDHYTEVAEKAFKKLGISVCGIHTLPNPVSAIMDAEAVMIGGGNTFRLLSKLYANKLIEPLRKRVLQEGVPYIGSSAGTNVSTMSICTTNDMPIVYPPSFDALQLVPFNINPHYIDPSPDTKHMGESRQDRIRQYHEEDQTYPVLGLREGCLLLVEGSTATIAGDSGAKLFRKDCEPVECPAGDVSYLLTDA
uniref:dipeptidase E n=2 Tax=Hirondellea gigas TaxID=1518452 RepID=A0A2P2I2H5_9CRUS